MLLTYQKYSPPSQTSKGVNTFQLSSLEFAQWLRASHRLMRLPLRSPLQLSNYIVISERMRTTSAGLDEYGKRQSIALKFSVDV